MIVNDLNLLKLIASSCFTKDTRATWIGPEFAETDNIHYKNYATWANQHLTMYLGFLPYINNYNLNVLDIGCGSGFSTVYMSKYSNAIDGIDYDNNLINFARKYNSNNKTNYENINLFDINISKKI